MILLVPCVGIVCVLKRLVEALDRILEAGRPITVPPAYAAARLNGVQLVPAIMEIAMLPISLAGWGLREATMGLAFGYAGLMVSEGVNVSLLFGAVYFLVGILGALVWILSSEKAEVVIVRSTSEQSG